MRSPTTAGREFPFRRKLQLWRAARAQRRGTDRFRKEDFALFRLEVGVPGLEEAFDGYRLAHLTDLHLGQWLSPARLEGVVDLTNGLGADLIALTGDFLSYDLDGSARDLEAQFARLRAPDGVFAVLGNHDHWVGADRVRPLLQRCGIRELRNDVFTLRRGGAVLHLAGVDDVMVHQDDLAQVMARLPAGGPALMLAHEPDFADQVARTGRFGLQLSGHSHGGQVVLPGFGPLIRGPHCWKYPIDRYQVRGMTLYTNRGLGSNMWWIRINCPPEIALVTLRRPAGEG
ncbi:MAG TPA: metallophosphoesterase [Anaerolineales bacterium]|nr:metallophosphoesterase [Anaerolineales bacterium]